MITAIAILNIAISAVLWWPTWRKLWASKDARMYSITSFSLILWLQASNVAIAIAERAPLLLAYMLVNTAVVGFTLALIWKYRRGRDMPAPRQP